MSDVPAVLQPDEPAVEPAGVTRTQKHQGRRVGLPALAGWLLVAVSAVGLLASTPPSGGPDETFQQATAWYLSGHGLPPDGNPPEFSVPESLLTYPCFSFHPTRSAACMPAQSQEMGSYALVLNYPPPYFWVVGGGERLAALVGLQYADVGGRIASLLLSLGTLLLVSIYMRQRNPMWGNFLLLVSTPTAVFLNAVVNPSGWEITCGIAMAAVLAEAAWGRRSAFEPGTWPKSEMVILALTSIGLSTARPLGFLWAAGLTVSAIALAPSIRLRGLLRIACAVAPGIVMGALWYRTHTYGASAPSTLPGLVQAFGAELMYMPHLARQMLGVLGWLDTPMPGILLALNIVAWAVLLVRLPSIRKAAIVCGVIGIVIVPCAIGATVWSALPNWWQGRYGLPFALGLALLLLLRSGRSIPRTISVVSGISLLSLGIMVWVNAVRYGFGLDGHGLPVQLQTLGIGPIQFGISAVLGTVLVLASGYLVWRAWRAKPDLAPGGKPEYLLTPAQPDVQLS